MKPNQKNRYNGRYNNNRNNNRNTSTQNITRHTALESSGPCGKLHGTALQLSEKYAQSAKDAQLQNDRVLAETCLQYSDHYARLQNIAIANEQSMRPQYTPNTSNAPQQNQQPQKQPEQPATSAAPSDVLPDFDLPTTDDELSEEDKAIKAMDLSIPLQVIQQNHKPRTPHKKQIPIRSTEKTEKIEDTTTEKSA